ncbi:MAG: LPS export ABC transporter periplasmic protein LptC [Phycisphaerales bacterium]|jgi:lipopolysaccharide export system protein LptA|nr:LPS export ABC transporter periplasmic protein LptC [Phycisphaerales bacterium]
MDHGRPQGPSARRIGLIVSICMAVLSLGVVGWFFMTQRGPQRAVAEVPPELLAGAPDVRSGMKGLGAGRGLRVQITDEQDPTRVVAELTLAKNEPLENRRYLVEEPRATIYTDDGRVVTIAARSGRLYWPDEQQRPESGTFRGDVVVRVFEPREDGISIDTSKDAPALTGKTDSLTFDMTIGEVSTPDRVLITGERVEFAGSGLKAIVNEARRTLSMLELRTGEYLRYTIPGEGEAALARNDAPNGAQGGSGARATDAERPAGSNGAVARGAGPAAHPAEGARPGIESLYLATFSDEVIVRMGEQDIRADQLEVWARLVDNKLRDGAIAELAMDSFAPVRTLAAIGPARVPFVNGPLALLSTGALAQAGEPAGASATQPAPSTQSARPVRQVVMVWKGALRIEPLDRASELTKDDVSLRFSSPATGLVKFEDRSRDARGHAPRISYGATSRMLTLEGPAADNVMIESPGVGRAVTIRVEADLASGLVHIPTPGVFYAFEKGQTLPSRDAPRQVSWIDQADFVLARSDDGGTSLREALIQGEVRGQSDRSSFAGDLMRLFVVRDGDRQRIERVRLEGNAYAEDGRGGSLAGGMIDVSFAPGLKEDEFDPREIVAEDGVIGRQRDAELRCERLVASLDRDERGDIRPTIAEANGDVRFTRTRDAIELLGSSMRVDAIAQVVDLTGEGNDASAARGSTRITGPSVRLDGRTGGVEVFGAWTFAHEGEQSEREKILARAEGARALSYNDREGALDASGDARAQMIRTGRGGVELGRDFIRGERITAQLEPRAADAQDVMEGDAPRKILSLHAVGASLDGEGGPPAQIEAVRNNPEDPSRLERLLRLEGGEIIARYADGTLDVPGAGRLALADLRDPALGADAEGDEQQSDMGRGSTLFVWEGGFTFDRAAQRAMMRRGVSMTHRRIADSLETIVECEQLTAEFRGLGAGLSGAEIERGELTRVVAEGAVYIASLLDGVLRREVIADRLTYDAIGGIAEVFATPGNRVSMFDADRATPASAEEVRWDLKSDRVEITGAGSVTTPR